MGCRVEVPTSADDGWVVTARRMEQESKYKAVVITTPNNPTGAVVPRREIDRIAKACARRGATLILDRTYAGFEYERPPEPTRLKKLPDNVLIAGSFSKVFSMTGWRVGYLAGSPEMMREALKAQDTTIICAPVISQIAVTAALKARRGVAPAYLRELRRRRDYVQERLQAMRGWSAVPAAGAFFTFIRVAGMRDSIAFVNELLEKAHVLMLPGSIFGRAGEGHIRLSYGVADIETLGVAFDRLRVLQKGSAGVLTEGSAARF
jgi:aspartate/methionine/tyrosine aminotransferase